MKSSFRISIVVVVFFLYTAIIVLRLFNWQIIQATELALLASSQRESTKEIEPVRGNILASDGFPLAINQEGYLVWANPQEIDLPASRVADMLTPIMAPGLDDIKVATNASQKERDEILKTMQDNYNDLIHRQVSHDDLVWAQLKRKLPKQKKDQVQALGIPGIYFDPEPIRTYPEASMAAQVIGFLGSNDEGESTGYFGLEGFYDLELSGRIGIIKQETDAINRPIPIGRFWNQKKRDGRDIQLHLDRSIQYMVESELKDGIERFGAASGSVIIMNPKTGGILAMASTPGFEPAHFVKYDPKNYVNPVVSQTFEPGSTFKILTVAAAINEGVITPDTICDICDRPFKIDKYYIRTWNNEYHKDTNMTEALAHSDNVAMVFIAQQLGLDTFLKYLNDFGIGQKSGIDLQGETETPLREEWKQIDLLTASFGQGLVTTPIQMIQSVGAIANNGYMMQPQMVQKIISSNDEHIIQPKVIRQVVSKETSQTLTEMLVASVQYGDAKWALPKGYKMAGKTGTAQVVTEEGYDQEKTIASFVGFAPADDPQFVMLTIIREPTSSPWGSETAAPLFFDIAKKLFTMMEIPRDTTRNTN